MIDHVGFPVSDYARAKAFYARALAPLGYVLIMEVRQHENDAPAAGFGRDGKPDFWIGGEGGLSRPVHIAILANDGAPGIRAHYHPDYYGAFVLDPDGHNIEAVCHKPG
jgi:catechol 2,3-dioxygenase-like lactoylglutathione lyase family enzyme